MYAMKILKLAPGVTQQGIESEMEHSLLEKLEHPYILSIKYSFQSPTNVYLITEFCAGGELYFHLKACSRFSEGWSIHYTLVDVQCNRMVSVPMCGNPMFEMQCMYTICA